MQILGTGTRDVEILAPLKIKSTTSAIIDNGIVVNGNSSFNSNVTIDSIGQITASSLATSGDVIITGALTVGGLLNTTSFYSMKPYVGVYVSSSGSVSTNVKPGFVTPTVAKTTGQYIFTLPTAHPSGVNYEVFVQQRMTASTTANAVYGILVNSSTSFTVWSKSTANALLDSDFYVHTVP